MAFPLIFKGFDHVSNSDTLSFTVNVFNDRDKIINRDIGSEDLLGFLFGSHSLAMANRSRWSWLLGLDPIH